MRCWLVLMAEDQVGALRYQQGDVVAVHPPEAHDGDVRRNPVQPPWWLISVPLSVEEARMVLEEWRTEEGTTPDGTPIWRMVRRRRRMFDRTSLPTALRTALQRDRLAVIPDSYRSQILGAIRLKAE